MFHNIHDIFHVSFLEPYRTMEGRTSSSPPLVKVKGKEHAEVVEILDSRMHYGTLQYLVKWLRFPVTEKESMKAEDLGKAVEYVTDFHEKYPKKLSSDNLHREKRRRHEKGKK